MSASVCTVSDLPLAVAAAGKRELYELGPGQQIKAMVRRVDSEAWKAFKNVAA